MLDGSMGKIFVVFAKYKNQKEEQINAVLMHCIVWNKSRTVCLLPMLTITVPFYTVIDCRVAEIYPFRRSGSLNLYEV